MLPVESDPIVYEAYIGTFNPYSQFLIYALGIVLFFEIKSLKGRNIGCRKLLSYSLLFISMILIYGQLLGINSIIRLSRNDLYGLIFWLIVVSQAIHPTILIDNPFFRTFGKYSYGIYLFQYIWLMFYDRNIQYTGRFAWPIKYVVSIIVLLFISIMLNKLFEKPIQSMIKRRLDQSGN